MDNAMAKDAMTGREPSRAARSGARAAGPHALLSGGGSGGHVFPGLAIAEELRKRGWQVSWAGRQHGLESRLVCRQRIPFHDLPARPVLGQGPLGKVRAATTLACSAWRARSLVRRLDARIVVGTGGYVSAPAVIGARLAARPAFLVEPNAEAGFANRWLSRLAVEAAVAFDETGSRLACPAHTAGVPVRAEFFCLTTELPPSPPLRLLVLGGSQGARQLNQQLPRALGLLAGELAGLYVCHQAGEGHLAATREAYRAAGLAEVSPAPRGSAADVAGLLARAAGSANRFAVLRFLDDVAAAMAQSHLIVSRAGAITLAEICAAGRPSLLMPLALAGGHQSGNARRLADAGAAAVLPAAATAEDLAALLGNLLADGGRLREMAKQARSLARPGAAAAIADRIEGCSREGEAS